MRGVNQRIGNVASTQRFLISRTEIHELGGNDDMIAYNLEAKRWLRVHAGVYQVDRRPLSWESELLAAVLACGPGAVVSHRAACTLWGLEGFSTRLVEATVPYSALPIPEGVVAHRTRRRIDPSECRGIPVTSVERTLLDCARFLSDRILGKALDSALRKSLTTIAGCYSVLATDGGRGVTGTRRFRRVLANRMYDEATDSGAEFDLLYFMQLGGLPDPELDHELFPRGGRRIPDFFWPGLAKAVEVDGIDAHSSAERLDDDLERQNAIMDLGIEIRRFSARRVRRDPKVVVEEIRRFLLS